MSKQTVSVIMGIYNMNNREMVKRSIDSILNQTYHDFEFIICDDGSSDGTWQLLMELTNNDDRVKLIKNKVNLGLAATLNHCLTYAKGKYIARMDADDRSHPERFARQVDFLNNNDKYSLVACRANLFDDSGIWGQRGSSGSPNKIDIFKGNSFIHPSIMIRKEALQLVGKYTDSFDTTRCEDYDLWCKLYINGFSGYCLEEVLLDYYEGKDSYTKRRFKYRVNHYILKKRWYVLLKIPNRYYISIYKPIIVGLIPPNVLRVLTRVRNTT